jgi:hypothetical protein
MTIINRNPEIVTLDDFATDYINKVLPRMYPNDARMIQIIASHIAVICSAWIDQDAPTTIGQTPLIVRNNNNKKGKVK